MNARHLLIAAICGLPLPAAAQNLFPASPGDGFVLPHASVSAQDDATSLEVNPAGLAFMETGEFGFGYETPTADRAEVSDASSAFFLAGGNGVVGTGFGFQSLEQPAAGAVLDRYRKYTWGLALALPRTLAIGLNVNWFGSHLSQPLDDLVTYDLGLQWRLGEHLAFGVMLRDVNEPFLGEPTAIRTRTSFGAHLRLFQGRLQLDSTTTTSPGVDALEWTPRLLVEPFSGIRLFASALTTLDNRVSTGEFDLLEVWGGLEVSFGSFGLAYAPSFAKNAQGDLEASHLRSYHWISPDKQRSVLSPDRRWITVNLNQAIAEAPSSSWFSEDRRTFLEVVVDLERAANDPSVAGVLVIGGDSQLGYAQAWEIRQGIAKLRENGKNVAAYLTQQTTRDYYIASAANQVWVYPTESFDPNDTQARLVSYRGVLNKLGVQAEFMRVGAYKSASEQLTHDQPSEASREQTSAIVDGLHRAMRSAWEKDRSKSQGDLETLLSKRPLFPTEAKAQGLIDAVLYPDELERHLVGQFPGAKLEQGYELPNDRDRNWRKKTEIAVIAIEGNIVAGTSSNGLMGASTGGQTVQEVVQKLAEDDNVAAIVVRINSPGGSAVASDQMFRALQLLSRQKPVIASMGDMAASGGYYAAAGAREVFATPVTITGSIGIFTGKFNAASLFSWLGVKSTAIPAGRTNTDIYEPWTDDEKKRVEADMLFRYHTFLTQIASTRALTADEFDKVARGRVWLGDAALTHRIVDRSGGLLDAIHRAEALAGVPDGEAEYRIYPGSTFAVSAGIGAQAAQWLGLDAPLTAQDTALTSLLTRLAEAAESSAVLPLFYASEEMLMLPDDLLIVE